MHTSLWLVFFILWTNYEWIFPLVIPSLVIPFHYMPVYMQDILYCFWFILMNKSNLYNSLHLYWRIIA